MHFDESVEASPTATSWLLNVLEHSRLELRRVAMIIVVQMTVFAPGRKQRQDPMIKNGQETAEDSGHAQQQNPWLRQFRRPWPFLRSRSRAFPVTQEVQKTLSGQ